MDEEHRSPATTYCWSFLAESGRAGIPTTVSPSSMCLPRVTTAPAHHGGPLADVHRGDEYDAGADERPIADPGLVLPRPVVIGRDGASTYVDIATHLGIAEVSEVAGDVAGIEVGTC